MPPNPNEPAARPPITAAAIRRLFNIRWGLLTQLKHAPGTTFGLAACLLFIALAPSATALALGLLVERIEAVDGPVHWTPLIAPLAAVTAMFILEEAMYAFANISRTAAGGHIDRAIRREVRTLALRGLAVAKLDDPAIVDDLARASDVGQSWIRSAGAAATGQLILLFRFLGALVSTVLLSIVLSPVLALTLLIIAMSNRSLLRRQWMAMIGEWDARERYRRRSDYWTELGRSPEAAKDLRMFGLGGWLVARRTAAYLDFLAPLWPIRRKVIFQQWPILCMTSAAGILALLAPGLALRAGTIDAAELVVCFGAAWGIFGILHMGHEAFDIEHGIGAIRALERLRAAADPATGPEAAQPARFTTAIRCDGVSFAYPGSAAPVIANLDLEIKAGEVIGLVGRNGVGKTTLIRLLSGLYRPDRGTILVDGTDLADLPADDWHRRISVVFQDFGRFPATLADNIAVGASEHFHDRDGVLRAARTAGIDRWLDDLPHGIDTVLGREFDDGADLSGGQWQAVAIARGLFAAQHGRDLLIFDEPTAHLDARSEAAFFDRVTTAITGAAIVLISHRLGTIRHADRIVMLGPEGIIEQGRHDELMAGDGEYARLFSLQASQFADLEPEPETPAPRKASA